jgi:hypothetical protein
MISRDGTLTILDQFEADHRLPKFQKRAKVSDEESDAEDGFSITSNSFRATFSSNSIMVAGDVVSKTPSWWERWVPALFKASEPEPTMTIEDFFKSVKNSAQEVQAVETRLDGYKRALEDANRNGQVALVERLSKDIAAVRAETQLHAAGFGRYVTEETLVRFVKECPKGLRLDYIRNFMRVIPTEVSAKKNYCDELGIFDNYAVLHYDPEGKAWAETEEEKERRKDPILFGLLAGRRRLYFDWVDEHCDLTLEQIADLLGEDAIANVPAGFVCE